MEWTIRDLRNLLSNFQGMSTQNGEDAAEVIILEFGLSSLLRVCTSKTTLTVIVITKYQVV